MKSSLLHALTTAPHDQETVRTDADILDAINVVNFPDGQPVALEAIFGDTITFDSDGAVSRAEAFSQVWTRGGGTRGESGGDSRSKRKITKTIRRE